MRRFLTDWLLRDLMREVESIRLSQYRTERMVMSISDDFKAFTAVVNLRTNEIAEELDQIKAEIAELQNPATPADVTAAMGDITARLQVLSDTAKAIAAGNQPVVPPPVEPPAA